MGMRREAAVQEIMKMMMAGVLRKEKSRRAVGLGSTMGSLVAAAQEESALFPAELKLVCADQSRHRTTHCWSVGCRIQMQAEKECQT
jgi:hypothetical protein